MANCLIFVTRQACARNQGTSIYHTGGRSGAFDAQAMQQDMIVTQPEYIKQTKLS